jgi:hypothetical protein
MGMIDEIGGIRQAGEPETQPGPTHINTEAESGGDGMGPFGKSLDNRRIEHSKLTVSQFSERIVGWFRRSQFQTNDDQLAILRETMSGDVFASQYAPLA